MASSTVDLDELQKEMLLFLPKIDLSALCCCNIFDPDLERHEHLEDCELRSVGADEGSIRSSDASSDTSSLIGTPREDDARTKKRKKHRESMARLRHGWRTSIAALQHQEEKLHSVLRRMIAAPTKPNSIEITEEARTNPLNVLRRSYRELVKEQLQLEVQRARLEEARAHRAKYERLLQRELVRIRLFHANDCNT
jgi:hypothetical protein